MMIALHVEPASMSARLKRSLKAIFTKLTPKLAPIVALVQMYAQWKQSIRNNQY